MANFKAIEDSARYMMNKYGLQDWNFKFNRRTRALGVCKYRTKMIELSTVYCEHNTMEEIRNTILHEIAHALTPGHHHDKVWKRQARLIGGTDNVKAGSEVVMPREGVPNWTDGCRSLAEGDQIKFKANGKLYPAEFVEFNNRNTKCKMIVKANVKGTASLYRIRLSQIVFESNQTNVKEAANNNKRTNVMTTPKTTPKAKTPKATAPKTTAPKSTAKKAKAKTQVKPTVKVVKATTPKGAVKKSDAVVKPKKLTQAGLMNSMLESKAADEDIHTAMMEAFNKDIKWAKNRLTFHKNWLAKRETA